MSAPARSFDIRINEQARAFELIFRDGKDQYAAAKILASGRGQGETCTPDEAQALAMAEHRRRFGGRA